jgi:hypothetical protein
MALQNVIPVGLKRIPKKGGGGEKTPHKAPFYTLLTSDGKISKKPLPFIPPCIPAE